MSGKSSTQSPRVRSSGDKLYQACLDSVITGIENFPVDKRQWGNSTVDVNNVTITNPPSDALSHSPTARATTPPIIVPLSPPPTPMRANHSSPPHSTTSRAAMNRAPLHGAPPHGRGVASPNRGPRGAILSYSPQDARGGRVAAPYGLQGPRPSQGPQSPYGSQDARGTPSAIGVQPASGNFAVQPVANAGNMKLKKMAVKIVSATNLTGTATPAVASSPAAASSPAPEPVKVMPREVESYGSLKPPAKIPTLLSPSSVTTEAKLGNPSTSKESALEDLFACLNAEITTTADDVIKKEPLDEPPTGAFAFEDISNKARISPASKPDANLTSPLTTALDSVEQQPGVAVVTSEGTKDMSKTELEQLYLRKAYDYLQALPTGNNVFVQILKTVSKKLRSSHAPSTSLSEVEVDKLQARFAFAIVNYVKNTDKSAKPITTDTAKYILRETKGDMLQLFSKLVDQEYLSLADIDSSAGLCNVLLDILPKAETNTTPRVLEIKPAMPTSDSAPEARTKPSVSTPIDLPEHVSKDPVGTLKAWPAQEKRENPAQHRACILKGVSAVKSINELQALVWGGRLESIQMPAPGSDFAVVRFLTPEACDKYFSATENGIELGGNNKTVIFVEKQPGPTSINDVVRNCTEGDASRCVRALDAEEDWSDMMLMKLARGKGQIKREIDHIKQGKTARGRHYIEFRFASIYHALNFKRQLMEDPEWEPCTISFATDPCETAQGVHYKDTDE